MDYIEQFISVLPVREEIFILLLLVFGVAMTICTILMVFRALSLSASLSVGRAQQLIVERKQQPEQLNAPVPNMPALELGVKSGNKPKRQLLTESVSKEAQTMLDRLVQPLNEENGWVISPSSQK